MKCLDDTLTAFGLWWRLGMNRRRVKLDVLVNGAEVVIDPINAVFLYVDSHWQRIGGI